MTMAITALATEERNCEIQIAGSGDGILPIPSSIRESEDQKNQRFLIHILPKNIINDDADEIQ